MDKVELALIIFIIILTIGIIVMWKLSFSSDSIYITAVVNISLFVVLLIKLISSNFESHNE